MIGGYTNISGVRGPHARQRPVTRTEKAWVGAIDTALYATLLLGMAWIFDINPLVRLSTLVGVLGGLGVLHLFLHFWLGDTLGRLIWVLGHTRHPAIPTLVVVAALGTSVIAALLWTWRHPMLKSASALVYRPFDPLQAPHEKARWSVAPFYFLHGAWPRQFEDEPIFYSFPSN
jgi:hypothetical protein